LKKEENNLRRKKRKNSITKNSNVLLKKKIKKQFVFKICQKNNASTTQKAPLATVFLPKFIFKKTMIGISVQQALYLLVFIEIMIKR